MRGVWFTEEQNTNVAISFQVEGVLHREKTPYQDLQVLETKPFGRMLVLDGAIQTTVGDEFVYHEMITMVPLNTHPNPRRVLVIGGGDGGTIREIVKHPKVEQAVLVEIDEKVITSSRAYLPEIASALDHPRVEVRVEDGIKHVYEKENYYDVIIVDSTDPVGPAVGLFSAEFYQQVFKALTPDGLFVAQTESPFFNQGLIKGVMRDLRGVFPITKLYLAFIPTYPGGMWSFTMGSKAHDPELSDNQGVPAGSTRYYTPQIHKAAFALPRFVQLLTQE